MGTMYFTLIGYAYFFNLSCTIYLTILHSGQTMIDLESIKQTIDLGARRRSEHEEPDRSLTRQSPVMACSAIMHDGEVNIWHVFTTIWTAGCTL